MTRKEFIRFVALMRNPRHRRALPGMHLERYLDAVAIGYEAVFLDPDWLGCMSFHTGSTIGLLRSSGITPEAIPTCSPRDQYRALADGRHGGLLDLLPRDPEAFSLWYHSGARTGQHPFEIVAGDQSHGILLRVDPVGDGRQGWEYELSVHSPGFFAIAVRMALALDRARVPFTFRDCERVIGGLVLRRKRGRETMEAMHDRRDRDSVRTGNATGVLPVEELVEVLGAENRGDLVIGGKVGSDRTTVLLYRGDLRPITVPVAWFTPRTGGPEPDPERLSVVDYGQTVCLGDYEAAIDAILYDFDDDYRSRVTKTDLS